MDTNKCKFAVLFFLIFLLSLNIIIGQDKYEEKSELLDLKLKLLDAKLELLDSKLQVWESKPEEMDAVIRNLEAQLSSYNFNPDYINYKFYQLDSLIEVYGYEAVKQETTRRIKIKPFKYDTVTIQPYRYVISTNPLNLLTGTLQLNFEKVINPKNSIEISGSITYATESGLTNLYLENQKLEYYNSALSSYMPYNPQNITGFEASIEYKNYLLARINPKQIAPKGLYVAPVISYRRAFLSGFDNVFYEDDNEWVMEEITRELNIYTGGVIIGLKMTVLKVLSVDGYIGGIIRLSQYDDENEFTKYKNIKNIDYSGVMPTAGLKIGILK